MNEKLTRLLGFDDIVYGRYAFEFELIKDRISMDERDSLALQAIECGQKAADKILSEGKDIYSVAEEEKLEIKESEDTPEHFTDTLLGLFQYPNKITIMKKAIHSAVEEGKRQGLEIDERKAIQTVISHEIFHFLENKNPKDYMTKVTKVTTFHLGPIRLKSKVAVLSEIAAMAFAKRLTGLSFSPYILDYLLMNTIDKSKAQDIYSAVIECSEK